MENQMKRSFLALSLAVIFAGTLFPQSSWTFDKTHSKIGFSVDYMLITDVTEYIKKFDGSVTTAKEDFVDALVSFTVDASTVDTDEPKRDEHLKGEDFFFFFLFPNCNGSDLLISKLFASYYYFFFFFSFLFYMYFFFVVRFSFLFWTFFFFFFFRLR